MKKILIIFLFFCCYQVFGTDQAPDKVIYNGKEYSLAFDVFPMEDYFKKNPEKHPKKIRLKESQDEEVEIVVSSGLWRGYVATFEIIENELYLKDIEIIKDMNGNYESIIHKIFPNGKKLKIDWLDGDFRLNGKFKNYDNDEGVRFESYIHLKIKKDKIVTIKELNHQELKEYHIKEIKLFLPIKEE